MSRRFALVLLITIASSLSFAGGAGSKGRGFQKVRPDIYLSTGDDATLREITDIETDYTLGKHLKVSLGGRGLMLKVKHVFLPEHFENLVTNIHRIAETEPTTITIEKSNHGNQYLIEIKTESGRIFEPQSLIKRKINLLKLEKSKEKSLDSQDRNLIEADIFSSNLRHGGCFPTPSCLDGSHLWS